MIGRLAIAAAVLASGTVSRAAEMRTIADFYAALPPR